MPIPLPQDNTIQRILIIKWGALGDLILATAIVEDIAKHFPTAEIHLNTLPEWRPLFEGDPRFKKIIAIPCRDKNKPFRVVWHWLKTIAQYDYDAVFDLQLNDRSRIFLALLFLKKRIRYRIGSPCAFPYNLGAPKPGGQIHPFTRLQTLLSACGIVPHTPSPKLYFACDKEVLWKKRQNDYGLTLFRYAVFIVGSHLKWKTKRWGKERFLALAGLMKKHQEIEKIVLVGHAAEKEDCAFIKDQSGPWVVNLCEQLSLFEIPLLCQDAYAIVSNDTGPAHLASIAGRPLVVLCGPTSPSRVKPIGPHVRALQANLPCISCYQPQCSHLSCMAAITPGMVLAALQL